MMNHTEDNEIEIDLGRLLAALWKYIAIILIVGILCSAAFFFYARTFVDPTYEANVLLFANNSSLSLGDALKITTGDLSAASSLVDTYVAILQSRSTMDEVAEASGVNYSYEKLRDMVSAKAVNSTGLFRVNVTSTDPEQARRIANVIADILPQKIIDIMAVGNVVVVDYAVTPRTRVSPNYFQSAAIGLLIGVVLASAIVILLDLLNDVIRDEEYVMDNYDAPVLATIPDLTAHSSGSRYQKYGRYGYGYGYSYEASARKAMADSGTEEEKGGEA